MAEFNAAGRMPDNDERKRRANFLALEMEIFGRGPTSEADLIATMYGLCMRHAWRLDQLGRGALEAPAILNKPEAAKFLPCRLSDEDVAALRRATSEQLRILAMATLAPNPALGAERRVGDLLRMVKESDESRRKPHRRVA